jgi:hypothetical protein
MGYGVYTDEMKALVAELVRGKEVWDLGAGNLSGTRMMLRMGAARVYAVDKEDFRLECTPRNTTLLTCPFADLTLGDTEIDVALVAWPVNRSLPGLVSILERARTVVYLGSNVGGDACGWPGLFRYLAGRELLEEVPHRRNSLLVYGAPTEERFSGLLAVEEAAALNGALVSYEEARRAYSGA